MEREGDDETNCNWSAWNGSQRLGKGAGIVGNWRTSRDHTNYSIVKVVQNTEKSPWDQKRLTVTQTLLKDHQHNASVKKLVRNNNNTVRTSYVQRKIEDIQKNCKCWLGGETDENTDCLVSWGYRIHWLHLCRGVRPPHQECPGYDT